MPEEHPIEDPSKEVEQKSLEDLQKENLELRKQVEKFEAIKEKAVNNQIFVAKKVGGFFLGSRLKKSLTKIMAGDLSRDNLAEVVIAVLYRFTRIGMFAFFGLLIALIPIILLWQQNGLIKNQNMRLDQQTQLLEADRRSALIFELGNVMDAVSRELADTLNTKDSLSNPLVGRIIALSRAMKPYKYLDPIGDSMRVKALSPERGHLLVSLYNSKLDSSTYFQINRGADFSYADLDNSVLKAAYLVRANLKGSSLIEADLRWANLSTANLSEADLSNISLTEADLSNISLTEADLNYTDLSLAHLEGAELNGASLIQADLLLANLEMVDLRGAILGGAELSLAILSGANLSEADLSNTSLFKADLSEVYLEGAQLRGSDLSGAYLREAKIFKNQLSTILEYGGDTTGILILKDYPLSPYLKLGE